MKGIGKLKESKGGILSLVDEIASTLVLFIHEISKSDELLPLQTNTIVGSRLYEALNKFKTPFLQQFRILLKSLNNLDSSFLLFLGDILLPMLVSVVGILSDSCLKLY